MYWSLIWLIFNVSFSFSVQENNAQIPVRVTFDPPSPVPLGVTTFRCEFEIGELNSLCNPSSLLGRTFCLIG